MGFAQIVLGEGYESARIMTAAVALLGGVVLWLWLRSEIGWMGALIPVSLWLLLPRGDGSGEPKLDRFAILEPYMVFFAILAMALAWQWRRGRGYVFLVASGVAMGLSVTSKVSTAILVPVFLVLILAGGKARVRLLGSLAFGVSLAATTILVYLPMGIRSAVAYMLDFQIQHANAGHLIALNGVRYEHSPWWANLWFAYSGMGMLVTLIIALGLVAAYFAKPRDLVGFLAIALLVLLFFYLVIAKVALGQYYYVWVWLLLALAGIGIVSLIDQAGARVGRRVLRFSGVTMLVLAVTSALWLSVVIAQTRPSGVALIEGRLASLGVNSGEILIEGDIGASKPYIGARTAASAEVPIVAIAVGELIRFPMDSRVTAYLLANPEGYEVVNLDELTLYVFPAPTVIAGR